MKAISNEGREDALQCTANEKTALHSSISKMGLLSVEEDLRRGNYAMSMTFPEKLRLLKFNSSENLPSPSAKFRQIVTERDEVSRSVPSSVSPGFQERLKGIIGTKIEWKSLVKMFKEWIKSPLNMAFLLWMSCVIVSGAILFLVMTGMLNNLLRSKQQRDAWFEVNNQILNALFTLICLYQHPKRFYHIFLLRRWERKDVHTLRNIYCKNGTYKPHEWAHIMVVVLLLHINCFAQYALCALNLGYKRSQRPVLGVAVCLSVAIAAPAMAGVYCIVSPLGKDYDCEIDEEIQEKRLSFASRNEQRIVEPAPQWRGRVFDLSDDIGSAYLSLFCSFCVFGRNMERLGFGNMYVHIATFLLFCTAPFWIFNLAANNVENGIVREALGLTGIVLCVFGLLYGGFWRIQMRKRFNLPPNNSCFNPLIVDCALWLFCCCCSLAQEVRTADFYDVVQDKFCRKTSDEGGHTSVLSTLPREGAGVQIRETSAPAAWTNTKTSNITTQKPWKPNSPDDDQKRIEFSSAAGLINLLKPPPIPSSMTADSNSYEQQSC